jgi:hypothetical protein
MYSINTVRVNSDCLEIQFEFNSTIIGKKILELSFNENKKPTFVESGYCYLATELEDFIKLIETNDLGYTYSFDDPDDPDIFDGFEFKSIGKKNYFVLKLTNARTNMEILIQITDENRKCIISDLNNLVKQIDNIIKEGLNFLQFVTNPEEINSAGHF